MFQWLVSFCFILASVPSELLVRLHFFNWKAELVHFKQDLGPQFPSDITKMLKYGANIIQAVGYFNANYIIAVAFINNVASFSAPKLDDYTQPITVYPAGR